MFPSLFSFPLLDSFPSRPSFDSVRAFANAHKNESPRREQAGISIPYGSDTADIDSRCEHTRITSLVIARHLAGGVDAFLFGSHSTPFPTPSACRSRRFFARCESLPRKRLGGVRKDNPPRVPTVSPSPSHPASPSRTACVLFYGTLCKLPKDWKQHGFSAGPACCAPPGDELLLSRASRSRGLTLCGLSLLARPRKAQIAKNNIAPDGEGENNRIGGDVDEGASGGGGGGCCCDDDDGD